MKINTDQWAKIPTTDVKEYWKNIEGFASVKHPLLFSKLVAECGTDNAKREIDGGMIVLMPNEGLILVGIGDDDRTVIDLPDDWSAIYLLTERRKLFGVLGEPYTDKKLLIVRQDDDTAFINTAIDRDLDERFNLFEEACAGYCRARDSEYPFAMDLLGYFNFTLATWTAGMPSVAPLAHSILTLLVTLCIVAGAYGFILLTFLLLEGVF